VVSATDLHCPLSRFSRPNIIIIIIIIIRYILACKLNSSQVGYKVYAIKKNELRDTEQGN
jgi:hypothetical protein